jgi:hypothetical protein
MKSLPKKHLLRHPRGRIMADRSSFSVPLVFFTVTLPLMTTSLPKVIGPAI